MKFNTRGHDVYKPELLFAAERQKQMGKLLKMDATPFSQCHKCGKRIGFKVNKENVIAESKCKYSRGVPEIVVKFKVPSGVIVLFNDLRRFYTDGDFDVNTLAGQKEYSESMAKQGLVTHFVGNTCPNVYQKGNKLFIGSLKGKPIGSICTDLWWYCAVDKDALEKRMGKTIDEYQKEYNATGAWPKLIVARVKPGVYKAAGRYHLSHNDKNSVFSVIEPMPRKIV